LAIENQKFADCGRRVVTTGNHAGAREHCN
jgi:hypothetical protein